MKFLERVKGRRVAITDPPPPRSNYLASARIVFPPISINSFLAPTLSPRTLLFMRPSPPPWKSICRYLFNVARFGAPMSINIWPGYLLIFNLRFLQNYIYTHISVYNFDGCQAWSQPGSFSLRIVRKSSIETPSNDVSRVSKVFLENFSMVSHSYVFSRDWVEGTANRD